MVPPAACCLLVLIGSSAAENLFIRRAIRDPYRHPKRHETTSVPFGTGSSLPPSSSPLKEALPPSTLLGDSSQAHATYVATVVPSSSQFASSRVPYTSSRSVHHASTGGATNISSESSPGYGGSGGPTSGSLLVPTGLSQSSTSAQETSLVPSLDIPVPTAVNLTSSNNQSSAATKTWNSLNASLTDAEMGSSFNSSLYTTVDPSALTLPVSSVYPSHRATGYLSYGTRPSFNPPRPTHWNASCGGATLNIRNASLDYWYPQTYYQEDSTFLIEYNENATSTGWTLLPASDAFNVTSALDVPTCTSALAYNTELSETMWELFCTETPPPVAAVTTTVEQTAYKPINQTTSKGTIPNVVVTPAPASLTVNSTTISSNSVPVVHFSQYEIVSKRPARHHDGRVQCIMKTEVYDLPKPVSFHYQGADLNKSLAVGTLGRVNRALLQVLDDSNVALPKSVSLGTFVAEPTVVVVVQKVVVAAQAYMEGNLMGIGPELETPIATLPSGLSFQRTTPTETGKVWVPVTPHIESSAQFLLVPTKSAKTSAEPGLSFNGPKSTPSQRPGLVVVPFVAHLENSAVTLAIPVDPTKSQQVVTADFSGRLVTATRINRSVDIGNIFTAVVSAAQPTDAEQVLGNALKTSPSDPLASAIGQGIGGLRPSGDDSSLEVGAKGDTAAGLHSGGKDLVRHPVLTIGGAAVTVTRAPGALVINGQTVQAGGPPVTISGSAISLSPDATAVSVAGTTVELGVMPKPGAAANIPLITVGSEVFTANAATQFNIHGATLTPGGQVVVRDSTIRLGPSAVTLLVNGQMRTLAPAIITPAPLLSFDGIMYRANMGSTYNIRSQMLGPEDQIIVSGTTMSLASGKLVVNGVVQPEALLAEDLATITAPPVLNVNGRIFSPDGGTSYVIDGQTLTPSGIITLDRAIFSLNDLANQLVKIADGHTVTSYVGMMGAGPEGAPVLTIGGHTYDAVDYSGSGATYIILGQTLTRGGIITAFESTISLTPAGTAVVMEFDGTTATSQISGAYGVRPTAAPILTIGGKTFTAVNDGATYYIDGETLTPDGTGTVLVGDRTFSVSLSPYATLLEILELSLGGAISATIYETLFPATAQPATDTAQLEAIWATQGSSPSGGSAVPTGADDVGPPNAATSMSISSAPGGALLALLAFIAALWL